MREVTDVEHLQASIRAARSRVLGPLRVARRKHLIRDEHVVLVAPRGVRATNESRTAVHLHLLVQRIEVVLVLRHERRVRWRPALDPVPDIQDDEAVVPVARV